MRLTLTVDNSFTAYLDGQVIASGSQWYAPVVTMTEWTPGTSYVLAIQATNAGGPGGVLVDVSEAAPMWTPLRFPGLYYDAETGLHENWNRFYDPLIGRYLSPEPMLQSPTAVFTMASFGLGMPTYAYAANNPAHWVDPTGLLYDVPCPPNTSCPENLGNFEPPGGTAGLPQQPQPWDPNALPPPRGAPSGTPIPFESSPMMQACLRKCREGRGRELMERMCAGRVSNPTAFRQCIDNNLKQIAWCEEDCRKVMPQQKGGELTCR